MSYDLKDKLVVGISSRALFNLEQENDIFIHKGIDEYKKYQVDHENEIVKPGTAFPLIQELLNLNKLINGRRLVEVVIMSRNSPNTGLRIFNSIEHYKLDMTRAAFTSGESLANYLDAFNVDLFLSKSEQDVQAALKNGVASAILYDPPAEYAPRDGEIRIAFDGDAVLFSDESEKIYKEHGIQAFIEYENKNKDKTLPEGPFAKLLKILSFVQKQFDPGMSPVKISIVTARNSPTHTRVIHTLRHWGVEIDEAFFLGGVPKDKVLQAFGAHIFFDDKDIHAGPASKYVPSGRVPYSEDEQKDIIKADKSQKDENYQEIADDNLNQKHLWP